jgi:hypothetical protein
MQVTFLLSTYFLPTFYNVTFDSNMCQVYSTKEKVDLFFGEAFEYTIIFML